MKHFFAFCLFFAILGATASAGPKDDYQALLQKGDYSALAALLDRWYKSEPKNPEVFIGYFNLHLHLAMKSGLAIDKDLPTDAKEYMTITDPKTGKTVGYMHGNTIYEESETAKAIAYLDQGLAFGPDRLDMYFGKIHVLLEIHDYGRATETLSTVFARSKINHNFWLWSDNKKLDDGRNFLLGNIQDYYNKWFGEKSKESLLAVETLSREQIATFPDHSWAYANLATAIGMQNKSEDTLPYLKKAVELDPEDLVNVNNLANYYRLRGNKELAKKYYKIIADSSDRQYSDYGKKRLEELEKK